MANLVEVVLENYAGLHDEFDALEFGDVFEGVTGDGDEVGPLAFFDGAHFVGPAQ